MEKMLILYIKRLVENILENANVNRYDIEEKQQMNHIIQEDVQT